MYEQVHADLNVEPQGVVYPNLYNFADLLSVGRQPRYLVDALLDRRFDAVKPIGFASPQELLFWEIYASGNGREESSYIWKLNQVIELGLRARRRGCPRASSHGGRARRWLRGCATASVPSTSGRSSSRSATAAGSGAGPARASLVLRRTPAPVTELHATEKVDGLSREPRRDPAARAASSCASAGRATRSGSCAAPAPPGASASGAHRCRRGEGRADNARVRRGGRRDPGRGHAGERAGAGLDSSHFSIYATRGSGARFDLGDLSGSLRRAIT